MFFKIEDKKVLPIELEKITKETPCLGFLSLSQLKDNYEQLGISPIVVESCFSDQARFYTSMDVYEDFSFGIINIIDVMNVHAAKDRVALVIKKQRFYFIELKDEDSSVKRVFENRVKQFSDNTSFEKIIANILNDLLVNGYESLETIRDKMAEMEKGIVEEAADAKLNKGIFSLKDQVSILKNYYSQLVDIGICLEEDENNLLDESDLKYITIFKNKSSRLYDSCCALLEDLVHLKEALNAMLDYQLNRVMKVFTVVTTVFLPLTLIVGWYGMNFVYMPELVWEYGYATVIILSVLVVIGCFYFFRKKKLL